MRHHALTEAEGLRMYERRSYVLHRLDRGTFEALNRTPVYRDVHGELHEAAPAPVLALNGYCLDALDEVPCGSMLGSKSADLCHQRSMPRGWTLAEREHADAVSLRLIAEVLAELAAEGEAS